MSNNNYQQSQRRNNNRQKSQPQPQLQLQSQPQHKQLQVTPIADLKAYMGGQIVELPPFAVEFPLVAEPPPEIDPDATVPTEPP